MTHLYRIYYKTVHVFLDIVKAAALQGEGAEGGGCMWCCGGTGCGCRWEGYAFLAYAFAIALAFSCVIATALAIAIARG
jgi:hypothetical protein